MLCRDALNYTFRNFFSSRNRNFVARKTIEQIEIIKGGSEIDFSFIAMLG